MGMTNMRPKRSDRAARITKYMTGAPGTTESQAPRPRIPRNTSPLTKLPPGYVSAFSKWPSSLAHARKLPEKVTEPMSTDSTMVSATVRLAPAVSGFRNSTDATSTDAPPPKALNTATIWGMAVMATQRERKAPMPPPMATPTRIQIQSRPP